MIGSNDMDTEIGMPGSARRTLSAAIGALALAAAASGPALGQSAPKSTPAPHKHEEAGQKKLSLDNGSQWATDQPLRAGMDRIRALVEPRLGDARKLTPAQYGGLASKLKIEVGGIVAKCKLEPKADAMLHIVIADLIEGADAMAGTDPKMTPLQGLTVVTMAVNDYEKHFQHPGFKPLRGMH